MVVFETTKKKKEKNNFYLITVPLLLIMIHVKNAIVSVISHFTIIVHVLYINLSTRMITDLKPCYYHVIEHNIIILIIF